MLPFTVNICDHIVVNVEGFLIGGHALESESPISNQGIDSLLALAGSHCRKSTLYSTTGRVLLLVLEVDVDSQSLSFQLRRILQ
jgi:hypothetical protein